MTQNKQQIDEILKHFEKYSNYISDQEIKKMIHSLKSRGFTDTVEIIKEIDKEIFHGLVETEM